MDNPFEVTLYNKSLVRTGWVNDPIALTVNPKHNAVGSATITVPANHRRLQEMRDPGARAVITYKGEHLMSGHLTSGTLSLPLSSGVAEINLTDDISIFWRKLGWPVPSADLLSQGTKQDTRTGPAETVAKAFLSANLAHGVDPVTVATSLGRGSTITISDRMMPLADQLMAAVDGANIGLQARQVGQQVVVDAYIRRVYPHVLSESAGTIIAGTLSWAWPTSTRTIIGGPDENTSREFRQVISSALETEYRYTVETFTDAKSSTTHDEMDAAGAATLAAGQPTTGIQLALSESSVFVYGGTGVRVGDTVSVDVGSDTPYQDVLREVQLSYTRDDGLVVTPTIGERADDPDRKTANILSALVRGLRDLRTR